MIEQLKNLWKEVEENRIFLKMILFMKNMILVEQITNQF